TGPTKTDLLGVPKPMSLDKSTLDELRIDRTTAPRRKAPVALLLILLIVVVVMLSLIWWFSRPKAAVVRTVVVQQLVSGGERTLLNASGYVTARRQSTVSSKVTGKVVEVLVEEGMKVQAGQVLARIDSSHVGRSLHLAEAPAGSARQGLEGAPAQLQPSGPAMRPPLP